MASETSAWLSCSESSGVLASGIDGGQLSDMRGLLVGQRGSRCGDISEKRGDLNLVGVAVRRGCRSAWMSPVAPRSQAGADGGAAGPAIPSL